MLDTFFKAHAYEMEQFNASVRRSLMDTVDWNYRLIGIRGPRGVGRTSFLLQYAKEKFDPQLRQCLYINLNNFYFQGCGIVEFAGEFVAAGGIVLLIDQVYKLDNWKEQLCECYRRYPRLRIIYSTTSVEPAEPDTTELSTISRTYVLHGFSFREFINLQTGNNFQPFNFEDLLRNYKSILKAILHQVRPWQYFCEYLQHGYYPFFLENYNFTEALLKAMNMMIEVDVLFNKQVELKYLSRIKRLLYMLMIEGGASPNVSRLAEAIGTSRATVINYMKYLEEARLINLVYKQGDTHPQKPAAAMPHNTNLIHAVYSSKADEQFAMETFFVNTLWRHHTVNKEHREGYYLIDNNTEICVCDRTRRVKNDGHTIFARYNTETASDNEIPLWLFGFLY